MLGYFSKDERKNQSTVVTYTSRGGTCTFVNIFPDGKTILGSVVYLGKDMRHKFASIFLLSLISLLAAGCAKVELRKEVPGSPKESYESLPK